MTFQLQPPAKVWDEEITTDKWPLPPAKPWEPKSSIEKMCKEARERLLAAIDDDCYYARLDIEVAFAVSRHELGCPSEGEDVFVLEVMGIL